MKASKITYEGTSCAPFKTNTSHMTTSTPGMPAGTNFPITINVNTGYNTPRNSKMKLIMYGFMSNFVYHRAVNRSRR